MESRIVRQAMESRIVGQAREFCSGLFSERKLSESQEFEIFSTAMIAMATAIKCDKELLKDIWLDDNISGIDGFFILVDNALYSISNYDVLFGDEEEVKFKDVEFCFVEAKNSTNVDFSSILKFYNTIENILKQRELKSALKNINKCFVRFNDRIERNATLKIKFYFCTQKTESDINELRDSWKQDIKRNEENIEEFIPIETQIIGSEFLRKTYESNRKGQVSISIPNNQLVTISEKCFVGYIDALSILKSIALENGEMKLLNNNVFEDNIRLFLGDTEINKSIQNTAQNKNDSFHLYNNGLTLVTAKSTANKLKSITFDSIRIINGCQTISSLFEIYKSSKSDEILKDVIIPVKIIDIVDEDEIEFIATSANSQNQINTYQLLSNREFFKRLEKYFEEHTINNRPIVYERRKIGEQNKQKRDSVDLLIMMRALMSSVFQIPHRASGYFDSTMNMYLASLKQLNQESYCKLIYIVTYLFIFVEESLTMDDNKTLRYHVVFIIFKSLCPNNIKKPRKMGEIPEWNDESISEVYDKIKNLLSNTKTFEEKIKYILGSLKNTNLKDVKTNKRLLYSPINKVIPDFDNFCSKISKES